MTKFSIWVFPLLLLFACSAPQKEASAPQALPVDVFVVEKTEVPNIVELPGRVEAVRVAQVRARVNGIVQQRLYEEGTDVIAGQQLFLIDPAALLSNVAQVAASLQRIRATATNAEATVKRYQQLVEEQAISRQDYDVALATSREAQASVAQSEAQLNSAKLQLSYTTVQAPIAGRVSGAEVTEGALVSATEATLLTRIEQLDPVYVTFAGSSSRVMQMRRSLTNGNVVLNENTEIEVELIFEDGTAYGLRGYVDFLDFSVNETTGTIKLRAEFPNPQKLLLPGEFVRARIFVGELRGVYSVPQRAVNVSATKSMVFVVDGDGKAATRPVELGVMVDDHWVIKSGLTSGDKVIVSNLQKVRAGMPVQIAGSDPQQKPEDTQTQESAQRGSKSS
jgi:membrane fusion protein (multidrug efflux system)